MTYLQENEDESLGARKPVCGQTGSKRSRAAEVHNLSERVSLHFVDNYLNGNGLLRI